MAYCNSKTKKCGKITSDLNPVNFPIALTIAGSDSGGGAGIQADLRTFAALRVYGTSAITALTAQNPLKVISIHPVKPEFLLNQLQAIFSVFKISSAKTGMLFNSKIIKTIASFISKLKYPPLLIIDPVMLSSSGQPLLQKQAISALKNQLFPLAYFITPNLKEAELITSMKISNLDSAIKAAEKISTTWNCNCILKGGHSQFIENMRTDIIIIEKKKYLLSSPNIPSDPIATHGTGCTLSAALAANLAKNIPPLKAIKLAKEFVYSSLLEKIQLSKNIKAMFPPTKKRVTHIKLKSI